MYRCSGDSEAHSLIIGDVLVLRGEFIDNIAIVLDRDPPELDNASARAIKRLPRAIESAWADNLICFACNHLQLMGWEALEPSGCPSGQSFIDVYKSLTDGARTQHEFQWYGTTPKITRRKRISERLRRLARRYEKILGHGGLRARLLAYIALIDGLDQFDVRILQSKTLARTEKGYLVSAPIASEVGDTVAIFQGAKLPFIVYRDEDNGDFRIRGDCYIPGVMDGELWLEENCYEIRIS